MNQIFTSEATQLSHSMLDTARSIGVERGVDIALRVIFARWATFQHSSGAEHWVRLVESASDDELVQQYALLSVFRDEESPPASGSREFATVLRRVVNEVHHAVGESPEPRALDLLKEAFDATLDLLNRLGKQAGEADTPPGLAELMAAVSVRPGDMVVDPVCGNGTGLMVAAQSQAGVGISGYEINRRVANRARMRLFMNGIDQGLGIQWGDALDAENSFENTADVVVAQPPWNATYTDSQRERIRELASRFSVTVDMPRLPRADMAWVLLAMDAMNESGRAALVLSGSSMNPSCRDTHEQMLHANAIEVIVALPPGLFTHTGIATSLWLLRAPNTPSATRSILMVDAQTFIEVGDRGRPVMSSVVRAKIESLVVAFRAGTEIDAQAHAARAVAVKEINLARGLHPGSYLAAAPEEAVAHPEPSNSMLTEVSLTNFKAFGERTSVPLAPLTLIFGANSSGKSSIIQSLLLLKQSRRAENLITQGPIVNVGSFGGVTHGHNEDSVEISISYGVIPDWIPAGGTPYPAFPRTASWVFEPNSSGQGTAVKAKWRFGNYELEFTRPSDSAEGLSIDLASVKAVFLGVASGTLLYPFDSRQIRDGDEKEQNRRLRTREANATRALKLLIDAGVERLTMRTAGLLPVGEAALQSLHVASDSRDYGIVASYANRTARLGAGMSEELDRLLEATVWLGPLRSAPKRVYDRTDANDTPGDGRHVAVYLFDHSSVVEQVNDWLQRLEVPYTLDVIPVTTGDAASLIGELIAIALTDTRSGVTVTPADVGFGISQVLPIVVELLARRDSIVAVEQPETHLHPRLQARLADLFIDTVQEGGRGNQLLVETHSEHLMLRVQRRIREGTLDPSTVSVIYVDQDSLGKTTAKPLRLSEQGDFIDDWPHGFFDERVEEVFGDF